MKSFEKKIKKKETENGLIIAANISLPHCLRFIVRIVMMMTKMMMMMMMTMIIIIMMMMMKVISLSEESHCKQISQDISVAGISTPE